MSSGFLDPMDKLAKPEDRCQFTGHPGARPEATHLLYFERACGCITLEISRPSQACTTHTVWWTLRGQARRITECRQCGAHNFVKLVKKEKL